MADCFAELAIRCAEVQGTVLKIQAEVRFATRGALHHADLAEGAFACEHFANALRAVGD